MISYVGNQRRKRWPWIFVWILVFALIYTDATSIFAQEIRRAKNIAEGRIGREVFGYGGKHSLSSIPITRAPTQSITPHESIGRQAAPNDNSSHLIGITWGDSRLVSFDPYAGSITEVHAQLNPYESFRGITYDPNQNKIYALSQSENNLYRIDPQTLAISHIGNLHIDRNVTWSEDAGALAYDSVTDALLTVIEHWDSDYSNIWSELVEIDVQNASLTSRGVIDGTFITSMDYNMEDEYLYGLATYGVGSWDSPYKSHVVKINPDNAIMIDLFETPYHTVLGFTKTSGENTYLSWFNWTSHFYGKINLDTQSIMQLGDADSVDVISALIYRNFDVGATTLPIKEVPMAFRFVGRVTKVLDPDNLLKGKVSVGDKFDGKLSYDVNAPYKIEDPNASDPYGITVTINGRKFSANGLRAQVRNNQYDDSTGNVSDRLLFDTGRENSNVFPIPMYYESIGWELGDDVAQALSNNDKLPKSFDLSAWDENMFYISASNDPDLEEGPYYYITGVIKAIKADRRAKITVKSLPAEHISRR